MDISGGECTITIEMIQEEKDRHIQEILLGLLQLHEDLAYKERIQNQATQRFEAIYNSLIELYFRIDKNNIILDVSPSVAEVTGYTPDELIGNVANDFYYYRQSDRNTLMADLEKSGGRVSDYEMIGRHKDGSKVYGLGTVQYWTDEEGNFSGIEGIIKNNTHRKKMEEKVKESRDKLDQRVQERTRELEESRKALMNILDDIKKARDKAVISEEKYLTLYADSPVMHHTVDLKGNIIECNQAILSKLGYTKKEYLSLNLKDVLSGPFSEQLDTIIQKILDSDGVNDSPSEMVTKSGEIIPCELSVSILRNKKGEPQFLRGTLIDITHRQEIDRLASFPLNNPNPIMELGVKGNLRYINKAGLIQLNEHGLKKKDYRQLLPKNFRSSVAEIIKTNSIMVPKETTFKDKTFLWFGVPLVDMELVHFYGTEISRQKNLETDLREARDRARLSDQLKNVFISTMSHEMRTPLNVIKGYADLFKNAPMTNFKGEESDYIDNIVSGANRLEKLVNDVLDISQIEAGRDILASKLYNGDDLVSQSVSEYKISAREKSLKMVKRLNGNGVLIHVDKMRFLQSLGNIIQNAVKFTEKGQITISSKVKDGDFIISVKDTGVGIRKKFHPHIYQLFSQEEEGYSRRFEGAGLGLAITRRLVYAMNGTVAFESQYGKGSLFSLTFPIARSISESPPPKRLYKEAHISKSNNDIKKIMILEDNKANLRYVEFLVKKLNLKSVSVTSGEQALKKLKSNSVDCILVDISLGRGMDGIQFLERLKKLKSLNHLPTVAVTAHSLEGDREFLLGKGFDTYLSKPFLLRDLANTLNEL